MALEYLIVLIGLVIIFLIIEVIFYFLSQFVNKKFQWLIIGKDEHPKLSREGLKKFISHGFDKELGWIRKQNTSHFEKGKYEKTQWSINSIGCRTNPVYENLNSDISCYGDSFTFCRQVNDDETWEHFLSKIRKSNVLNYGVGNYGLDQALLRLKREFPQNPTKIVILAVVPDTISRIVSVWKHYYEYGNTFGFKPRYELKDGKLVLIKNIIDDESKFFNYVNYLDEIKKHDYFYIKKFKKEKIHFPYSINVLKNFKRNISIIFWILRIHILKKRNKDISKILWNPMRVIMEINLKWRIKLFNDTKIVLLFKKIIQEYVLYSRQKQFTPIFVFLPQKDDIIFIKNNFHFYERFLKDLSSIQGLHVLDISQKLLEEPNLDELYSDDNSYGGHYSKQGNKKIALYINQELINFQSQNEKISG